MISPYTGPFFFDPTHQPGTGRSAAPDEHAADVGKPVLSMDSFSGFSMDLKRMFRP